MTIFDRKPVHNAINFYRLWKQRRIIIAVEVGAAVIMLFLRLAGFIAGFPEERFGCFRPDYGYRHWYITGNDGGRYSSQPGDVAQAGRKEAE